MNGSNMKQQVFYIHGGNAYSKYESYLEHLRTKEMWHMPKEGESEVSKKWMDTFVEDLGDEYQVIGPQMPNKQNARFVEWSIWFERHFEYVNDGVILIGHSLGAMFLAKYLSKNDLPFRPKAIFLMSGRYQIPNSKKELFEDSWGFMVEPQKVKLLLNKTENLLIYHSKDDFVVPYEHGLALSQAIPEAEFVSFEVKNHFLTEEFPELLNKIKRFKDLK